MRKSLKKFTLVLALFISTVITAEAQIGKPKGTLGFNVIYANPLGKFRKDYQFGFGAEVYGGVGWDKTFIIGTLAYRVLADEWCFCYNMMENTTVKVGLRQFFLRKHIFVQGDVGIASVKKGGAVATSFSPGIGTGVRLKRIEFSLYYDTFKLRSYTYGQNSINANSINAKLGYSFSL